LVLQHLGPLSNVLPRDVYQLHLGGCFRFLPLVSCCHQLNVSGFLGVELVLARTHAMNPREPDY